MKLTKLQQHYNKVFKYYRRIHYNAPYIAKEWGNEKFYQFKRMAHMLMNEVQFKIEYCMEYGTAQSTANKVFKHGVVFTKQINNTLVRFEFNNYYNKFDAYTLTKTLEHDLVMSGETYKLENNNRDPVLEHIDFNKTFTEEMIFQESLLHNYNILFWQEIYNILTVLNSIKDPNVTKIYLAFKYGKY